MRRWLSLVAIFLAFGVFAAACGSSDDGGTSESGSSSDDEGSDEEAADEGSDEEAADEGSDEEAVETVQGGGRLAAVLDRGVLNCGGNDTLPGFGIVDADGEFSGFDIDFCRVVAAAVLGDANAVEITPLVAAQRFPTLQAGDIDVMIRNTTWTASRDGSEGAEFLTTTFYDGQGFMVRADSGLGSLDDLANTTICVLQGTTTLLNLNSVMAARGIPFTALEFESNDELQPAFTAEQCEVWTSDASQLAAFAANIDVDTTILEDIISKEPLGPVVADGDSEWAQVVNWAVMSTIQAEEFGINSGNVDSFLTSDDPGILRFLGQPDPEEGTVFESGLGLPADFALNVISQVGNYSEIYERNITPIGLPRGLNSLWSDGGLLYVPPFR